MAVYMNSPTENQKLENLLNLALDATVKEREKSEELNTGYDPVREMWDLIVKYSGSLDKVRILAEQVVELQNEYAIVTIRQDRIEEMASLEEV